MLSGFVDQDDFKSKAEGACIGVSAMARNRGNLYTTFNILNLDSYSLYQGTCWAELIVLQLSFNGFAFNLVVFCRRVYISGVLLTVFGPS